MIELNVKKLYQIKFKNIKSYLERLLFKETGI